MKVIHALLLILSILLIQFKANACSCVGPDRFMHSVGPYIMEVEVLEIIALDTFMYAYSATRVQVNRMIKGEYTSDTLLVLIDKGFECFKGLPRQEKGKRYIITGDLLNEWNSFGIKVDSSYYGRMMVLDLCMENVLYLNGDRVIGNITKNKQSSGINYKFRRILMTNENYQNWVSARMNSPKYIRAFQGMTVAKLERKLRLKNLL
jgi:hypothetical protein